MVRIGIIAEGKSEWLVFEEIIRTLRADVEFQRIRPDITLQSGSPFGWNGVKAWCRQNGSKLDAILRGVTSHPLHLLVVHLDCSMAHNEHALRACPPASDTADALRAVILAWLGLAACPPFLIITATSRCTEAWVVSALGAPPYKKLANVECEDDVEEELARRKLLPRKDGEVKKPESRYLPLAQQTAARLTVVRHHCTQAERFCQDFVAAVAGLPGV